MKGFIRFILLAGLLLLWSGIPTSETCLGQVSDAYSTIAVGVRGGPEIGSGSFQDDWSTGPAVALSARMPFHVGDVEAGAHIARYHADAFSEADFISMFAYAGWGVSARVGNRVEWRATILVGDFLMRFDRRQASYSQRENELGIGAASSLAALVSGRVALTAGITAFRVFTSTPIDLIHATAGVEIRLSTPRWLRAAMQ